MKRGVNGGRWGSGRPKATRKRRPTAEQSPLGRAYARLVRSNAHYYGVDRDDAATKTARDMRETSDKYAELIGERLAEIVGARAGTALPAVLATVSERFPE